MSATNGAPFVAGRDPDCREYNILLPWVSLVAAGTGRGHCTWYSMVNAGVILLWFVRYKPR